MKYNRKLKSLNCFELWNVFHVFGTIFGQCEFPKYRTNCWSFGPKFCWTDTVFAGLGHRSTRLFRRLVHWVLQLVSLHCIQRKNVNKYLVPCHVWTFDECVYSFVVDKMSFVHNYRVNNFRCMCWINVVINRFFKNDIVKIQARAVITRCNLSWYYVDGLVQHCSISGVLAMEILQVKAFTWASIQIIVQINW